MKIWVETALKSSVIERILQEAGIVIDRKSPDFVISYGGDGTLLKAERIYPGIPKIAVKSDSFKSGAPSYGVGDIERILASIFSKSYVIRKYEKLEASFGKEKLIGLNEIQVHNRFPGRALRFSMNTGTSKSETMIGDGIVVSTPYGSTGYYSSLGLAPFRKGIRIGFNNPEKKAGPISLGNNKLIVTIIREKALIVADNNPRMPVLSPGDTVKIKASSEYARIVEIYNV